MAPQVMKDFETVSTVIKRRRSIRRFNGKPVDMDLVRKIIDTASHAPSNNNRQGWKFYIIGDNSLKETFSDRILETISDRQRQSKLADALLASYKNHFIHFKLAPVVVVCCFVKPNAFETELFRTDEENRHMSGELISLSLVIQNILLLAESAGLGSLVMTSPLVNARDIKAALRIPAKFTIGALVCMGHYDKRPDPPRHHGLERILHQT